MNKKHSFSRFHDRLLNDWGFDPWTDVDRTTPFLSLNAKFESSLQHDLQKLLRLVVRLQEQGRLPLSPFANRLTHGVGAASSKIVTPIVARPDFVVCNGQPKLLELNIDSALGGLWEIATLSRASRSSPGPLVNHKIGDPVSGLGGLVRVLLKNRPSKIILMPTRGFSQYNLDVANKLAAMLAKDLNAKSKVAFPDQLDIGTFVRFEGEDVGVLVKLDVMIDKARESSLAKLLNAASLSQTAIISDNRYVQIEDKETVAHLWDLLSLDSKLLKSGEADALRRLLLPTFLLNKELIERIPDIVTKKNNHVLKRALSYGGSQTLLGASVTEEQWAYAISKSIDDDESWIVQEFATSDSIVPSGGSGMQMFDARASRGHSAILSPFVFGAEIFGYLCRIGADSSVVVGLASKGRNSLLLVASDERK